MADVTWPSISSALDETLAQLDALHRRETDRRQTAAAGLAMAVARLGESSEPWRPEEAQQPSQPSRRERRLADEPIPFVPLPERTTHGGPFGPKVRAKLIAEALADRW